MIRRITNAIKSLFSTIHYVRKARMCADQYKSYLQELKYENKSIDGENAYIKLWSQLTARVEPYSYRLFSHYMGKVPHIIPDYIGTEILFYYLNPRRYSDFYEDKNTYSSYVLLENAFPKTYLKRIGAGKILHEDSVEGIEIISSPTLCLQNLGVEMFILKPTVDTCSGEGVMMFKKQNERYVSSKGILFSDEFLNEYGDDYVIQEVIQQHPDLAKFNPTSVNTLRICTYRSVNDELVTVTGALIRIGKSGEVVDNAHAGGCFVGIDLESGNLLHYAGDQYGNKYEAWNGISFSENHIIPHWPMVKDFAEKIASYNKHSRLLAFDLTVDRFGIPRVIEINVEGFAHWIFQFCGQDVFNGEVQSVIDYCNKKLLKDGRKKLV